ncbi:MAG: MMPL family transporter [Pseudomonadota bacterium]
METVPQTPRTIDGRLARWLIARRRLLAALSLLLIPLAGSGIRFIERDPSVDAFVPPNHTAALMQARAREQFGVEDPFVIGLLDDSGASVLTPAALDAIAALEEALPTLTGVEFNDRRSLLTSDAVFGTDFGLEVEPIVDRSVADETLAATVRTRLATMPMLDGLLISRDESALLLVVPVVDPNRAEPIYRQLLDLTAALAPPGYRFEIAGVAAMNSRLDQTVSTDTRRLVPLAFLTALLLVGLALKRARAVAAPLVIIAASTAVALGALGWAGSRYYLITTALPVVVMAIAIADCLHIALQYVVAYRERQMPRTDAALETALSRTLRPVTLTSWTTAAGFLGLAWGANMIPIAEFGTYAAVGVLAAWLFSLTLLPALIGWFDPRPLNTSPKPTAARIDSETHAPAPQRQRLEAALLACYRRPSQALGLGLLLLIAALASASVVRFDYERARYFRTGDPVRLADASISDRFGGLNALDVVIESPDDEPLLRASRLEAIADIRHWLKDQPGVVAVDAIDDYINVMGAALLSNTAADAALDDELEEVAPEQFFFAYEAASDPGAFDAFIEPTLTLTRIRARLDSDRFSTIAPIVGALRSYLEEWSQRHDLKAEVSGRLAVNAGWMEALAGNHPRGLALALGLVTLTCCLWFRRGRAIATTLAPVSFGVLFVYALMGLLGIDIAPATAMTSAIATGLGVDFGIHLVSHLRQGPAVQPDGRVDPQFLTIVRACLFSALALCCALLTICISSAPPLRWFGILIAASALGSLTAALLVVPACARLFYSAKPAVTPTRDTAAEELRQPSGSDEHSPLTPISGQGAGS